MKERSLVNLLVSFSMSSLVFGTAMGSDEAPDYVNIKDITYGGSGCPAGTVGKNVSSDKKAFTLTFSEFLAEAGPGIDVSWSRSNCQILIDMEFPQGWSYSVASFDYRGYAYLDRRVTATQKATYYFQGDAQDLSFETKLKGEYDDDFHLRDEVDINSLVWSDCSATRGLNINTQVRVNNRRARYNTGFITIDSIDGEITHKYSLRWKRCGDVPQDPDPTDPTDPRDPPGGDPQPPIPPRDPTGPTPDWVKINSIQYNGSGCPLGTVSKSVSSDKQAFTLLFDSYIAEVGPGISLRESRKNCQVILDLDYPIGWTFSIMSFDYRGYAYLDNGLLATQKTNYYFQGESDERSFESNIEGYFDNDYHFRDVLGIETLLWGRCDARRALNINSQVRINNSANRRGAGIITLDATDGSVVHTFGLVWRQCP